MASSTLPMRPIFQWSECLPMTLSMASRCSQMPMKSCEAKATASSESQSITAGLSAKVRLSETWSILKCGSKANPKST